MGENKMTKAEKDRLVVEKLPPFTAEEIKEVKEDLERYFTEFKETEHFMLLSHEGNYYTIFKKEKNALKTELGRANDLLDFLMNDSYLKTLGKLKVAKRTGNGYMEFWLDSNVFLLFDADGFFVEI